MKRLQMLGTGLSFFVPKSDSIYLSFEGGGTAKKNLGREFSCPFEQ